MKVERSSSELTTPQSERIHPIVLEMVELLEKAALKLDITKGPRQAVVDLNSFEPGDSVIEGYLTRSARELFEQRNPGFRATVFNAYYNQIEVSNW